MNSQPLASDESLARLARSGEESFFSQLKTLEDFLASQNHTLESALQLLYSNPKNDPNIAQKAEEMSRRTRDLYQFRDFLKSQNGDSGQLFQASLAPSRMRRLARV